MEQLLKFGNYISIHGIKKMKQGSIEGGPIKEKAGLLSSPGFFENAVFVEELPFCLRECGE